MKISVGLVQHLPEVSVTFNGRFRDSTGTPYGPGLCRFNRPIDLRPENPDRDTFLLEDVTIGVGFHWERKQEQGFNGSLRLVEIAGGLTAINEVELEAYVESVISSEMSARSPLDLLKAHAVISRSWIVAQIRNTSGSGTFREERQHGPGDWEILSWYGPESHEGFDVCADDHCQRYQGLAHTGEGSVRHAVTETAGQFLVFGGDICDARFSKCCGGVTDEYRSAWEDREVPYLASLFDGDGEAPVVDERWIRSTPAAYCNADDPGLLSRVLPGFDQETKDFYRWHVDYSLEELTEIVRSRSGVDLGKLISLEPTERGPSGRIVKLKIRGEAGTLTIGKELEIRRVLSRSHLYSSAFVTEQHPERITLIGAGWGHGVGLCQIGAAVMADQGVEYHRILEHYYPQTSLETRLENSPDG